MLSKFKSFKSLANTTLKELYAFFTNSNQRTFFRLFLRYGNLKRYSPRNIKFNGYKITAPDLASVIWQYKDIFVDESYKFETTNEKPIIYDCGANIGLSCLYFKTIYPGASIKAFEADSSIGNILEENLKANNLITDVEIINKAVWIENSEIEFIKDGADGGSIFTEGDKSLIPATRLRDYLEKESTVDFLKMNIEGAETEVIIDCKEVLSCVKNIFIEYHSFSNHEQSLDRILSILSQSGFRYYLQPIQFISSPLINKKRNNQLDVQVNIFANK